MKLWQSVRTNSFRLALFALIGASGLAWVFYATVQRIDHNKEQALLLSLQQVLPPALYDNMPTGDTVTLPADASLGQSGPHTLYIARKQGFLTIVVFNVIAPEGYSGEIELLVAVRIDGTIAGVDILRHKETPGLGDKIERNKGDWLLAFNKRNFDNTPAHLWTVKKDGGVFDQLTGATITPRAVVKAVYNTLQYFEQHQKSLMKQIPSRIK